MYLTKELLDTVKLTDKGIDDIKDGIRKKYFAETSSIKKKAKELLEADKDVLVKPIGLAVAICSMRELLRDAVSMDNIPYDFVSKCLTIIDELEGMLAGQMALKRAMSNKAKDVKAEIAHDEINPEEFFAKNDEQLSSSHLAWIKEYEEEEKRLKAKKHK